MKKLLLIALCALLVSCSSHTENKESTQETAVSAEDSSLLAEVKAAPDTAPRQISLFNNVSKLQNNLRTVGIGEMRKWWTDGNGWMSACNFYEIGTPGPGGLPGNLAFYLESPSENYVESLKVKVNINNMAEKKMALTKYASTVEKTFKVIGLPMPAGLKPALLTGKVYENDTKQRTIKNIFEPGNFDSWKLQVISH